MKEVFLSRAGTKMSSFDRLKYLLNNELIRITEDGQVECREFILNKKSKTQSQIVGMDHSCALKTKGKGKGTSRIVDVVSFIPDSDNFIPFLPVASASPQDSS